MKRPQACASTLHNFGVLTDNRLGVDISDKLVTGALNEWCGCRNEYEEASTPEAQICKDFDKIEMIMQAYEYEEEQPVVLQSFFDSTAGKWRTELGCVPTAARFYRHADVR
jgi:hypothetical protein